LGAAFGSSLAVPSAQRYTNWRRATSQSVHACRRADCSLEVPLVAIHHISRSDTYICSTVTSASVGSTASAPGPGLASEWLALCR
jgi:hypothetical protein